MGVVKEFRLFKDCQRICAEIIDIEGNADKRYRYTLCKDLRERAEQIVFLIRRANKLPPGHEKRFEYQSQCRELLEQLKDLIWISGKTLMLGPKREASIEASIENAENKLQNWIESDEKRVVAYYRQLYDSRLSQFNEAIENYKLIVEYCKTHDDERSREALDDATSRGRIAQDRYVEARDKYNKSNEKLRIHQNKYHKDDSVLAQVLKEIKASQIKE